MSRWLPHPLMFATLLALWLLLNQSLSAGQIVLGCVLAVFGSWALTWVEPPATRLRRPQAMARLALRVLVDIARSNLAVARIILSPLPRPRVSSRFVRVPLDLRHPYGLATLACIITATPGTVWADFDSAKGILLIHVLDLTDESDWISTIKRRYESLLLEIFE